MTTAVAYTKNQKTIVREAVRDLKKLTFQTAGIPSDAFHKFASLHPDTRTAVFKAVQENTGLPVQILVFLRAGNGSLVILQQADKEGTWVPYNDQAAWPPNKSLHAAITERGNPYKPKKGYLSDRNTGILYASIGLMCGQLLPHVWTAHPSWVAWIPTLVFYYGVANLLNYHVGERIYHKWRQARLFRAMMAEGITFDVSSTSNVQPLRAPQKPV